MDRASLMTKNYMTGPMPIHPMNKSKCKNVCDQLKKGLMLLVTVKQSNSELDWQVHWRGPNVNQLLIK